MPSFVYFDLDDTLLDHSEAERRALADFHRESAEHFGTVSFSDLHAAYRQHNGPLWYDYGRSRITKAELKHLRFANTLRALGVTTLDPDHASTTYLDRYSAHWHWSEGAREAFRRIAEAHRVGILTNGFREQQRAKLAKLPEIEAACEPGTVLIAEEIGTWKPHAEAFALAAERAGVAPEEILYIGDSLRSDVEGGVSAGWTVAWWHGDPAHEEHGGRAVSDWAEVARLAGL
ncbi:MAG: HAD-IA family hydrolase [Bacteroidota bacterium]